MRVYNLPKNKIDEFFELTSSQLSMRPAKKLKDVRVVEIDEKARIVVCEEFKIGQTDGVVFPFLADVKTVGALPAVIVDTGAIKFVCNGADIMRPGIVRVDGEFSKGVKVAVRENTHGKAIAVGEALFASNEIANISKGAVVKNLHYIGDRLWEEFKKANL